ncbi:acyltransferase [Flavobacterium sp.]|uniref:acyltransferase n=1 Tax=Flavobacterium sp. TaxID=239 RepID=UPI002602ECAD|nr:acyltransferase [Flavobacterium sp.]MDG2432912.1 acyltransferase [Flavobacterium sp.]
MKSKIKIFLSKIVCKLILPTDLINIIENEKRQKCLNQVTIGVNSNFHVGSEVENYSDTVEKISIGSGTHIRGHLLTWPYTKDGIIIGDNCYIGKGSVIWSGQKIKIGNNVLISHNVTIIDSDSHELDPIERADSYKKLIQFGHPFTAGKIKTSPIIIEDYVWISYNVSILKGVTIGTGAIIGAGSIITKDVAPFSKVVGNSSRILNK